MISPKDYNLRLDYIRYETSTYRIVCRNAVPFTQVFEKRMGVYGEHSYYECTVDFVDYEPTLLSGHMITLENHVLFPSLVQEEYIAGKWLKRIGVCDGLPVYDPGGSLEGRINAYLNTVPVATIFCFKDVNNQPSLLYWVEVP